ncbi:MAG: phage portal protein [Sulfitobacter sp.]|jgi:lambda family phage portal protein
MAVSLLDKVVLELSPARGHARIRSKAAARVLMNYDAATTGRRAYGWKAPGSSAEVAAGSSRARMRNLARDFVRNRALAARAVSVIATNVVGTGITPSVVLPKDLANADSLKLDVEKAIKRHLMSTALDAAGCHNLFSFQSLAAKTAVTDGEILFRRRWRNNAFRRKLALPFQIEALEADHLDEVKTSHGNNEVVNGIEISPTGEIVAYHLKPQHPGGWLNIRNYVARSERVPAADMLHIRRLDRPGQLRGVSWFAPVMLSIGELSDYQEAEILKQKMAALLAGVIETDLDDGSPAPGGDETGLEDLAPGALVSLNPGQKVSFTTPPKVDSYEAFMRGGIRTIAIGLGITYEALSGDLSGVNFSSGRMGRMEMNRNIADWQSNLLVTQFCEGIERWFVEAWNLDPTRVGVLPEDLELTWTPPRAPVIDPTKEIPAAIKEMDAGLTSRSRKQRELGLDPEKIHKERLEDIARDQEIEKATTAEKEPET